MTKEKFLESLGLVSMEQLKSKSEVKRVERRRRTTANPKYNSNGFVELRQLTKRPRRFEEVETCAKPSTPKRMTLMVTVEPKEILLPKCYVCEQTDTELTCESCHSQYHADCIRVTGSKAPKPTRLSACPNCISARLESFKLLPLTKGSDTSASSSNSSIIPLGVQKNSTSTSINCRVNQSVDYISSKCTKSKIMKKSTPGTTPASNKASMTKKGVYAAVTQTDSADSLANVICKPVLSPFKSLTALTSKGKLGGGSRLGNSNGEMNGGSGSKSIKKKSKLNGVKAKTLSVTGKSTPSNHGSPLKAIKHKASPLNNLNGNINNVKTQSNYKNLNGRLQSFAALTADQPLLMQRTILAMTAAAKSVMSSNGLRVASPVSVVSTGGGGDLKNVNSSSTSSNSSLTDKDQSIVIENPPLP